MKRKSDFNSNGLDQSQISQVSRLFVIDRDYENSKKPGNVTCPAWQHFGFLAARDESVGDVNLFETKRANTANTNGSATASTSETESASASVAYCNRGLLEGERIVDKTSY